MVHPRPARADTPAPETLDVSEIFRRHGRAIERWASRLGGPLVDSDDVVQDVMAVVHRRIAEFRPDADAALTRWLYRITLNVATSRRRRERLRRWLSGLPLDYTDDIAAYGPSAVDEIERREAALEV